MEERLAGQMSTSWPPIRSDPIRSDPIIAESLSGWGGSVAERFTEPETSPGLGTPPPPSQLKSFALLALQKNLLCLGVLMTSAQSIFTSKQTAHPLIVVSDTKPFISLGITLGGHGPNQVGTPQAHMAGLPLPHLNTATGPCQSFPLRGGSGQWEFFLQGQSTLGKSSCLRGVLWNMHARTGNPHVADVPVRTLRQLPELLGVLVQPVLQPLQFPENLRDFTRCR